MTKKYYYENTFLEEQFPTLWDGYLFYEGINIPVSTNYFQESNRDLDDLLAEVCDVNFYVTLVDNYIYLSVCSDFRYYAAKFEKDIRKMIKALESKFNIVISNGEFYANELKHHGNQYKYSISQNDKIILKKRILNFDSVDNKLIENIKKRILNFDSVDNKLIENIKKLNI